MGITNFLKFVLESSGRLVDLRDYPGLKIAVDVSTWTHRACQANSDLLADEKHLSNYGRAALLCQNETDQDPVVLEEYLAKCCKEVADRLDTLRQATKSQLLVVFDGRTPPAKRATVAGRRQDRLNEQHIRDESLDVSAGTPELERKFAANRRAGAGEHYETVIVQLQQNLRELEIPFLVSPYEADSQLAFLQNEGLVDLVITEDSDLIAYGLSTPVLFRIAIGQNNEIQGVLVRKDDLATCKPNKKAKFDFLDFNAPILSAMFAASGCDYAESLRGVGAAVACRNVRDTFLAGKGLSEFIKALFQSGWDRASLTSDYRKEYKQKFLAALMFYRHGIVYDPVNRCCRRLHLEVDPEFSEYGPYWQLFYDTEKFESVVGLTFRKEIATYIAEGIICPKSFTIRETVVASPRVRQCLKSFLASHPEFENPKKKHIKTEEVPKPMATADNTGPRALSGDLNGVVDLLDDSGDEMGTQEIEQVVEQPKAPEPVDDEGEEADEMMMETQEV